LQTIGDGAARLVLLRHGQSEWNANNRFTGWANPDLTEAGEREAVRAGRLLGAHRLLPDTVHTSLQRRAIHSADLALAACDRDWIAVHRSWRLNGRHYGALQGMDKAQARAEFGEQRVQLWRRSYAVPPPPAADARDAPAADAGDSPFADPRYAALPPEARPRAESLRDVTARLLPYWYDFIVPALRPCASVLVVSHGNTLRALIKHLDGIGDEEIAAVEIAHGVPLVYELGPGTRPLSAGRYLSEREDA
jgi:2,3-bisphosphoglycerate-dependent phosphoglycerate mutase